MSGNKILNFNSFSNKLKFVTTSVWIDCIFYHNAQIEKRHFAVISVKNLELDIHVIHPLSEFITTNWKNQKYNTQRKHAVNIVQYLNYLLENRRKLDITSLTQINTFHGTEYLNYLTMKGVKRSTVKDAERTLTKFYDWLIKIDVLHKHNENNFIRVMENQFGEYLESPFQPIYPSKKANEIEHTLPLSYIPLLLEVAIEVAKPIALGIYFQIFGGIRISEAVNLKRTQVARRIQEGDFMLKLNNENFRTDLKEHASVKKVRTQRVLEINDWGHSLFNDHYKLYKSSNGSLALFINRDGKAMSQRSYRQYFQKVKDRFISLLEHHGDAEQRIVAKHLKQIKWSTHIGRGTFTNMVAEDAENPYEIAHLRGDSNINSSLTYLVSTERIHKKIEEKFSNMHGVYIPKLISRKNKDI